jgi:hypothetical protein
MKINKIFYNITAMFLLPLWLGLLTKLIEEIPWLLYTAFIITSLLLLANLALTVREIWILMDSWYTFQCRRMDRLVNKTRKKLQRTIKRTKDPSVMDYALTKLQEICNSPEIFTSILIEMAEKERRPDIKEILLIWANQNGGNK